MKNKLIKIMCSLKKDIGHPKKDIGHARVLLYLTITICLHHVFLITSTVRMVVICPHDYSQVSLFCY